MPRSAARSPRKRSPSKSKSKNKSKSIKPRVKTSPEAQLVIRNYVHGKKYSAARSRSASLSPGGSPCLEYLRKKIKKNMKEYYSGARYVSPKQALAVSYAQTIKAKPACKLVFKR
jgi:hypothetical protein